MRRKHLAGDGSIMRKARRRELQEAKAVTVGGKDVFGGHPLGADFYVLTLLARVNCPAASEDRSVQESSIEDFIKLNP